MPQVCGTQPRRNGPMTGRAGFPERESKESSYRFARLLIAVVINSLVFGATGNGQFA